MVNLKKLFKSITKPNGNASSSGGSLNRLSPRAILPSSESQFSIDYGYQSSSASMTQRSPPKPNYVSATTPVEQTSSQPSPQHPDASVMRLGMTLARIPRLVSEATNSAGGNGSQSGSPSSNSNQRGSDEAIADFVPLLALLRQMGSKEYQEQIRQYYMYTGQNSSTVNNATAGMYMLVADVLSNREQRRTYKQCRRSLLLCWKFAIAQLNDERIYNSMSSETCDTYYQLLSLIAERVEFNIGPDAREGGASSTASSGYQPYPRQGTKSRSASQSGTAQYNPSGQSPKSSASAAFYGTDADPSPSNGTEESSEGERDMYLYRCLLVATFKNVIENIEAANAKRRSFISFSELQCFGKILAICFFRIPVVQRMILDMVFEAYRQKRWVKTTVGSSGNNAVGRPETPSQSHMSRLHRRRSSSRPWHGMTFAGTLMQWSEFEGQLLAENVDDSDETESKGDGDQISESSSESGESNQNNSAVTPPHRNVIEKFKRQNPTLFRWTRFAPYLGPYADVDVFRTHDSVQAAWLVRLVHDSEFFACFMTAYAQHAELVSYTEPVWYALPGYSLLIRTFLLLTKEAAWKKWQAIRDMTENIVPSSSSFVAGNQSEDNRVYFEVRTPRAVKTVLDSVAHLLKNRDILESCVMAVFECTNMLNIKSVGACLSRLEEWFAAAAVRSTADTDSFVYRLPSNFHGQALGTAIRMLLCSESFEILNRVLLFLYNRMDYFDGELRQNVLKAIIQRHMYLFLHWNTDVRDHYHHLLIYKTMRVSRHLLNSPIDQLLIGRLALMPLEVVGPNRGEDTSAVGFDDTDGPDEEEEGREVLTAAQFNMLRLEQALWRAFDACLAAICVQERRNAREGNRKYQVELQAARCRANAFQYLNQKTVDEEPSTTSVNEGLPGGKASHEVDLLDEELNREPPYYLRFLPADEVSRLDELRRLASAVKYPADLQAYAAASLRQYSDLLKQYFKELWQQGSVEAPPLGYC
ncbi:hypothetical protein Poli38472_009249 [Pythium oligandrum]|uniref:Uncharacterized protein n=1 Tax=Pythium oligandrum TaxID=41045 RepID=A0A8K1CMI2_PYTOL|nr:hypothetical protein Poli38472_009249 [Pythium oligandrum]|eukprot:TMW65082.1 hypothetical protein Poli38472_009249 [Pythium oligandrum]